MAKENPYRYAEAVKAYQRADNDIKAQVLDAAVAQTSSTGALRSTHTHKPRMPSSRTTILNFFGMG